MSARETHWNVMIHELDGMRDAVASSAHVETDRTSHLAYMMQAKSLRAIYGAITSLWFNVAQEMRAAGTDDKDAVELRYADRLAHWLRTHESQTADAMEGGGVDASHQRRHDVSAQDLAVLRLYAKRHHDMVADYCLSHAEALESRVQALSGDLPSRLALNVL